MSPQTPWSHPFHDVTADRLRLMTRAQLIEWLEWNDNGNGCWTDEQFAIEYGPDAPPATTEELRACAIQILIHGSMQE